MASLFKRGKGKHVPYTIQYTDHAGQRRTVKGFTDKGLSEQLAAKLESEARLRVTGLVDVEQERMASVKQTPLTELMVKFQEHLAEKNVDYSKLAGSRVKRVMQQAGCFTLGDVQLERTRDALRQIQREKNLGPGTYNHYQESLHVFGAWCVKTRRLLYNPLHGLERLNVQVDVRRPRRALSPEEVGRIIAMAIDSNVTVEGFPGPERARLYRLAYMTGLRRNELASLTKESFQLTAQPPTLTVEAAYSKHRRKDVLPLHPELAAFLVPWLQALATDEPLFPKLAGRKTARMLRTDLAQAGIPYRTKEGYADFHATGRHTYITELLRNGTSLPEAKELARHSDVNMTMRYTHIGLKDQAKAIVNLPLPQMPPAAVHGPRDVTVPTRDHHTPATTPALHRRCNPGVTPCPAPSHSVTMTDRNPRGNSQPGQPFDAVCRKLSPRGNSTTPVEATGGTRWPVRNQSLFCAFASWMASAGLASGGQSGQANQFDKAFWFAWKTRPTLPQARQGDWSFLCMRLRQ